MRKPVWALVLLVLFAFFAFGALKGGGLYTLGVGFAVWTFAAWRSFMVKPSRVFWIIGSVLVFGYVAWLLIVGTRLP